MQSECDYFVEPRWYPFSYIYFDAFGIRLWKPACVALHCGHTESPRQCVTVTNVDTFPFFVGK